MQGWQLQQIHAASFMQKTLAIYIHSQLQVLSAQD